VPVNIASAAPVKCEMGATGVNAGRLEFRDFALDHQEIDGQRH
jgi:hypothetical protein